MFGKFVKGTDELSGIVEIILLYINKITISIHFFIRFMEKKCQFLWHPLENVQFWLRRNRRYIVVFSPGARAASKGSAPGEGLGSGFSARSSLRLVGSAQRLQLMLHRYGQVNPDSLMKDLSHFVLPSKG